MTLPADHGMFPYQLAEYLYREGVCGNPLEDVAASAGFPAPFAYIFQDSPNRAMCVTAVTVTNIVSDSNPEVNFTLMFRGDPDDQITPIGDAERAFHALHDLTDIELTATQGLLVCRRIVSDPLLQDSNRRWYRADAYRALLAVPTP